MKKLLALVLTVLLVLPAPLNAFADPTPSYVRASIATVDPRYYGAVCNGQDANATKDTNGIVSAVAYVNTQPASTVLLQIPGTCVIDGTATTTLATITANNVTVQGGLLHIKTPTIPLNQFFNVPTNTVTHWKFLVVSGNNVTIQGVTFDSNGQATTNCGGAHGCLWFDGVIGSPTPSDLRVMNSNFPGLGGWPVLSGGAHTLISGNFASESAGMVCANGATDCVITKNRTTNAIDAPYAVNGGSTTPGLVVGFVISNNTAEGVSAITPNGNGIDVSAATDGVVSNNQISGMGNACIMVDKTGGFYSGGAAGTYLPSQRVTIADNHCKSNNTYGGWPQNAEIVVGDLYSANGGTPWVAGDTANNILVTGNQVAAYNATSNDIGVYVGYGAKNVVIADSYFSGCGTALTGACGVTPYRILDQGQTANLTYTNNHQDSLYAGTIRTQGPGPYEIWGNGPAWTPISGGPSANPFRFYGDLVANDHIVIPQAVTGFQGSTATKVILGSGSFTQNNSRITDANGNEIDSGTTPTKIVSCGTTSTCANTVLSLPRTVFGTVTLSGGAATVSSMTPFTSTSSFACTATDQTSTAAAKAVPASTSSITITGTGTDIVAYSCSGN